MNHNLLTHFEATLCLILCQAAAAPMHGFTAAEVGRSRAMGQLVASRADRLRTKVNTEHLCNMSSTCVT